MAGKKAKRLLQWVSEQPPANRRPRWPHRPTDRISKELIAELTEIRQAYHAGKLVGRTPTYLSELLASKPEVKASAATIFRWLKTND